jgi:hypothetical protein
MRDLRTHPSDGRRPLGMRADRVLNRSARRVCAPDVLRLGEQVAVDHDAGSLGLFEGGPLLSAEIG